MNGMNKNKIAGFAYRLLTFASPHENAGRWLPAEFALFILLFLLYSCIIHMPNVNENSRYDLLMSIVDGGTLQIDKYAGNTIDKAFYKGHYYTDKAPGLSFFSIPFYAFVKLTEPALKNIVASSASGNTDILQNILLLLNLWLTRVMAVSFFSALFSIFFFRFLRHVSSKPALSFLLTIGYSLGTLAYPYSTVYYGHQLSSALIFTAFIAIVFALENIHQIKFCAALSFLSGILAGFSVLIEYPTALIAVILSLYFAYRLFKLKSVALKAAFTAFSCYVAAGAVCAALLFLYNWKCFDSPFSTGYSYVDARFIKEMGEGVFGVTYPKLEAVWGTSFSPYRGLFILSPFLILIFPAFIKTLSLRTEDKRSFYFTAIVTAGIYFIFNCSYYLWNGGDSIGPRHFIPALPFVVFAISVLSSRWNCLCGLLVSVSVSVMLIVTVTDSQVPEKAKFPFFEHSLPEFFSAKTSITPFHLLNFQHSTSLLFYFMILTVTGMFALYLFMKENRKDS